MNAQLTDSEAYTSLAGALDKFLNLEPLVNSIEGVLNDYRPATYAVAFILLVVGAMREFLYPETRRFLQAVLRTVLLVATISFASSFIDWCDQAAQALAQLPAAQQVSFGNLSYSMTPGEAPTVTQLEQVLQTKIKVTGFDKGNSGSGAGATQNAPQFSGNPLVMRLLNNSDSFIFAKGCLPGSLDLSQDLLSFSPPDVPLGFEVMPGEVLHDGIDQLAHAAEAAGQDRLLAQVSEEAFDQIHPG